MKLILMIIISLIFQIEAEQKNCYAEKTSPYLYFAMLTSYFSSRRSEINIPKNCSTIHIWAIIRHGTRYPSASTISKLAKSLPKIKDEIITNHGKGRGSLCKKDLDNLQNWNINLTEDLSYELAQQGEKEMIFLAQKVKQAFPTYFKSLSKDLFMFQSSDTNRTRDSAIVFTNELMGTNFTTIEGNNITEDGEFLQKCFHCPSYLKQEEQPILFQEANLFKSSALWQKTTAEISIRLGFLQPLSYDSIRLMYNICAYEKALYINTKSPFCAVFTTDDLKVIEYLLDLQQYHQQGYGNPHPNENLGCPIVRDMMLSLSNAAKNIGNIRGKFLFSHSETMVPMMVKLGLNKDEEPLKLENYNKLAEKRKWRSTFFSSFAANFIAALHKCPSQNGSQNVVSFHQNEYPVMIPQCASDDLCTLEEIQNIFQDVFDENHCNTDFCQIPLVSKSYSMFFSSNVIVVSLGFLFNKYYIM